MRTQFKFTLRLICTPEYKYAPEYIYTRVFFAHANWTLNVMRQFACLVFNQSWLITTLLSLMHAVVGQASDSFMISTESYSF